MSNRNDGECPLSTFETGHAWRSGSMYVHDGDVNQVAIERQAKGETLPECYRCGYVYQVEIIPVRVSHPEGSPNGCSDHCSRYNIHPGDEVTGTCMSCGGNARGCVGAPGGCWESRQAAADARDRDDYYPGGRS